MRGPRGGKPKLANLKNSGPDDDNLNDPSFHASSGSTSSQALADSISLDDESQTFYTPSGTMTDSTASEDVTFQTPPETRADSTTSITETFHTPTDTMTKSSDVKVDVSSDSLSFARSSETVKFVTSPSQMTTSDFSTSQVEMTVGLVKPFDFFPEIEPFVADSKVALQNTPTTEDYPNIRVAGTSRSAITRYQDGHLPINTLELKLLCRYRKAETFDVKEIPGFVDKRKVSQKVSLTSTSIHALPANWKQANDEEMNNVLGIGSAPRELASFDDLLKFHANEAGTGFYGRLKIKNISSHLLTVRVRAFVKSRYRLTPPVGCIEVDGSTEIYIETDHNLQIKNQETMQNNKFLLEIIPLKSPFANKASLFLFWKAMRRCPFRYLVNGIVDDDFEDKKKLKRVRKRGVIAEMMSRPESVNSMELNTGKSVLQLVAENAAANSDEGSIFENPWCRAIGYVVSIAVFIWCFSTGLPINKQYSFFHKRHNYF